MSGHIGERQQPGHNTTEVPFFKLSNEIIIQIINFINPASHCDFASTCRLFANCSYDILQDHQDAYNKYRVSSDLLPSTVPKLLRSACGITSPIAAWHVRSFEVWGTRASWADWRPFELQKQTRFDEDSVPLDSPLSKDEMKTFLDLGCLQGCISETRVDLARGELQDGRDGFIKMLLFSLCPRLRDLKFVRRGNDHESESASSLIWMESALWNLVQTPRSWPLGFLALRDVAIGVLSGVPWIDDHDAYIERSSLASFLHLPNIVSLYVRELIMDQSDDSDDSDLDDIPDNGFPKNDIFSNEVFDQDDLYGHDSGYSTAAIKYSLPPRCSSVENLYLDIIYGLKSDFQQALLRAPRNLLSIAIRGEPNDNYPTVDNMDDVAETLAKAHAESLQSVMFYNPHTLGGYRCNVYIPSQVDYWEAAKNLRHITLNCGDVELGIGLDTDLEEALATFENFPETMQALAISGKVGEFTLNKYDDMECLEDGLVRVIECGRYKNLKAIIIDHLEPAYPRFYRQIPPREKLCFLKVIAAGKRHGVDVHTWANRSKPQHTIDFPAAVDKYDLATGPYGGLRARTDDGNWEFSVYSGCWEPAGCRNCGNCERCFRIYPEHIWKSLDDKQGEMESSEGSH